MICETVYGYCKDDISKIENYELAIADKEHCWECHHRLETHNSDGEPRKVHLSRAELIVLGVYYYRPASELIFLSKKEHRHLHLHPKNLLEHIKKYGAWNKGIPISEEQKKKISKKMKGRPNPHTSEWNEKIRKANLGNFKGMHWKVVDGRRVWY